MVDSLSDSQDLLLSDYLKNMLHRKGIHAILQLVSNISKEPPGEVRKWFVDVLVVSGNIVQCPGTLLISHHHHWSPSITTCP